MHLCGVVFPHLAGRCLTHHRLIWRGQVSWVQGAWAVDRNPIYGTEGRMGKVQMQASVRDRKAKSQSNNPNNKIQRIPNKYNCPLTDKAAVKTFVLG